LLNCQGTREHKNHRDYNSKDGSMKNFTKHFFFVLRGLLILHIIPDSISHHEAL
jgi:hypothetical protein